jgi:hypothetical protein
VRNVLFSLLICTTSVQALPVFPGAEGFGTQTGGGRGGTVCKVTNINDDGEGSLRHCLDSPDPRTVIFNVSGIIRLESSLTIQHPYISIFGQTAHGDGILITGVAGIQQALLTIASHDVVIQHLRIHPSLSNATDCCSHALTFGKSSDTADTANIVIDHCTLSGGSTGIITSTDDVNNVTFSHNIIGPGRSYTVNKADADTGYTGFLFNSAKTHSLSLHHNLIAHNQSDNPGISTGAGVIDIVNNLVYNWGQNGANLVSKHGKMQVNLVHNLYVMGKDSDHEAPELAANNAGNDYQLFLEENLSIRDPEQAEPLPITFSLIGWPTADWEANERFPSPPITTYKSQTLLKKILPTVGATLPHRDAIDKTLISETREQQGATPPCPSPPDCTAHSATPADYASGSTLPDKDNDGIPNDWEETHSLAVDKEDAAQDFNVNGYTNIEEWIFSLTPSDDKQIAQQKNKSSP